MKYPLKWYQQAARELVCYFGGHKWVHSPSRHTEYFGKSREEVPYSYRVGVGRGNYMWEEVASWSYKCRRCRMRVYGFHNEHLVWYKKLYWALQDGTKSAIFYGKLVLFDAECFPAAWWKRVVLLFPIIVSTFISQTLVHYWDANLRPSFPFEWTLIFRDWLCDMCS